MIPVTLRTLVSKVASLAGAGIKARNEWKAWELVTAWVVCSPGWESSSTERVFFHHCLFLPLSMAKTELWKLLDKQRDPSVMFGDENLLQKAGNPYAHFTGLIIQPPKYFAEERLKLMFALGMCMGEHI